MNGFLQSLFGVDTNAIEQQAAAAQQQLSLAFQVLIAEGAVACILLALILAKKRG